MRNVNRNKRRLFIGFCNRQSIIYSHISESSIMRFSISPSFIPFETHYKKCFINSEFQFQKSKSAINLMKRSLWVRSNSWFYTLMIALHFNTSVLTNLCFYLQMHQFRIISTFTFQVSIVWQTLSQTGLYHHMLEL